MKKTLTAMAVASALCVCAAHAGGVTPAVPAEVVIVDTTDNSGHILVPIVFLILAGLALAD